MKRNLLKRIGAVALAVAVSLTMGTAAFAADPAQSDQQNSTNSGIASTSGTIKIAKEIIFVNAENTTVREPNLVYTYSLSSANPSGATVKDENEITATVKAGVLDANTNTDHKATISFADTATIDATSNGTSDRKYAEFSFDVTKFTKAGIYRYAIAETVSPAKATVGVTEAATYASTRYLDVYVQNGTSGLEIYGYVLYEGDANTSFDGTSAQTNISKKSEGFVNTATETGKQADVDVYKTQNQYVYKTTTGTMADPDQTFTVTMKNTLPSTVTAAIKLDINLTDATMADAETADTVGPYITSANYKKTAGTTATVKDGSIVAIKGIPEGGTTVSNEKNDSSDSYKVKAGTAADGAQLLPEKTVEAGAVSDDTSSQTLSTTVKTYYTNTLNSISPTNVVMRFAPYLFILGAAIILLVVMRRRKAHDAE